jgi:hypothetical protein
MINYVHNVIFDDVTKLNLKICYLIIFWTKLPKQIKLTYEFHLLMCSFNYSYKN